MWALIRFLNWSLEGGLCRSWSGWGSLYNRSSSRIWKNHEFLQTEVRRTWTARWWSGSPCNLQVIPNNVNCLRRRMAVPGSLPAIKETRQDGDVVESFMMFCSVLLYCWSTHETSFLDRTRLDSPDMRTGVPYMAIYIYARMCKDTDQCLVQKCQNDCCVSKLQLSFTFYAIISNWASFVKEVFCFDV